MSIPTTFLTAIIAASPSPSPSPSAAGSDFNPSILSRSSDGGNNEVVKMENIHDGAGASGVVGNDTDTDQDTKIYKGTYPGSQLNHPTHPNNSATPKSGAYITVIAVVVVLFAILVGVGFWQVKGRKMRAEEEGEKRKVVGGGNGDLEMGEKMVEENGGENRERKGEGEDVGKGVGGIMEMGEKKERGKKKEMGKAKKDSESTCKGCEAEKSSKGKEVVVKVVGERVLKVLD